MTLVTWQGDPVDADVIEQFGTTFPKGKPVKFEGTAAELKKLDGNPWFRVGKEKAPEPTSRHQVGDPPREAPVVEEAPADEAKG